MHPLLTVSASIADGPLDVLTHLVAVTVLAVAAGMAAALTIKRGITAHTSPVDSLSEIGCAIGAATSAPDREQHCTEHAHSQESGHSEDDDSHGVVDDRSSVVFRCERRKHCR